ncbi:MAG TPA: SpoIIE family protein phosphatase, partial [Acidobacteriaceae bacterium]|nr:SpoIIE family protein phosphatase [Acidobacteriaceae bacterium]
ALVAHASTLPEPLNIQGLGKGTVALDGDWQFHLGDDPAWASPALDDLGWERIAVDKPWGEQTHFGYTGYAWYRRHVNFLPVSGVKPDLALLLPRIDDAYEVYWNGSLIGHQGKLPPHPHYYRDLPSEIVPLGQAGSGLLAFRVWKAPYFSADTGRAGGLNGPPLAGPADAIAAYKGNLNYRWLQGHLFGFAIQIIYGFIAFLGFISWFRNRTRRVLFWMSAWACALLLSSFFTGLRLPFTSNLSSGIQQPLLSVADIAIWYLLLYLLELDRNPALRRCTRILAYISIFCGVADGILILLDWSGPHVTMLQIGDALLTIPTMLIETYPLVLIGFAIGKRLDTARWLVAILGALAQLTLGFQNFTGQGQRFTHWTISHRIPFELSGLEFTFLLISILYAVYRYSVEQSERQGALEQEFKSAQELQQVLIPETLPSLNGYAVTSAYRPAQQVGGDFFQLIAPPDGSALLVIGDVSGKGLKAAMTVSLIVGTIRTVADTVEDPAEVLSILNRRLHGRLKDGFVTCLALRLDAEGDCVLANAGHPAPFLNREELSLPGALPLGLDPGTEYEKVQLHLAIGDRLTLYTDGLLEARNPAGDIFSFDRLRALIATQPDAKQATDAAVAFGQDDDITVITLTRLAPGVESTTSLLAPELVSSNA